MASMVTGLRQTLAAAVQRSSTSASSMATGSDPAVGTVYMNAHSQQPQHQQPQQQQQQQSYAPPSHFGAYGTSAQATPPQLPGSAQLGHGPGHPVPGMPQGMPQGVQQHQPHQQMGLSQSVAVPSVGEAAKNESRDRELEKLRRELRKADEKSNFFRNQVITLQQQISSMGMPVMGVSAAAAMPEEITRLRAELAEERAEMQALKAEQVQVKNMARADSEAGACAAAALQERERELAVAVGRAAELEKQLAVTRQALAQERIENEQLREQQQQQQQQQKSGLPPAAPRTMSTARAVVTPMRSNSGAAWSASFFAPESHSIVSSPCHQQLPRPPQSMVGAPLLDLSESSGGPRRAVVVGCDYPGKTGTLRAGVADAEQWAKFFTKRCALQAHDIRFLCDDPAQYQQKPRPDLAVATRDNILQALQWLVTKSAPGDQLFFVFCGQGAQIIIEDAARGQRLCENACCPTDVCEGGEQPRVVSDTDIHKVLLAVPAGAQVTLIYDACHAGRPLDRAGLDHLTEYVSRGRVDYEKLRGHPVLPRFLELPHWKARPMPDEAARESRLQCQAVQWAACANTQFCVELPIDDRPRGVFTYIFISCLLKAGVLASNGQLLKEARDLTAQLKDRWRLQQDVQLMLCQATSDMQPFLRS